MQSSQLYIGLKAVWQFLLGEISKYPDRTEKTFVAVYRKELQALLNVGQHLSLYVMDKKSIPPGKVRTLESATKVFMSARQVPRKPIKWLAKYENHIEFLLLTERYPEKEIGGLDLFELGPFRVHNLLGLSEGDLKVITDQITRTEAIIKKSGVPKITSILYGDLYLAGNIQQAHTLAWYNPAHDNISISVKKSSGKDRLQALAHEFGHRYFQKVMAKDRKQMWLKWHERCGFSKVTLPKVGDPLGFPLQKIKNPIIQRIVGVKYYVTETGYMTAKQIRQAYREEFSYPTRYSGASYEEHFCEAFALFVMGNSPAEHAKMFTEIIIKGNAI